MRIIVSCIIVLFFSICGNCQAPTSPTADFEKFSTKQDELFIEAYKKKDVKYYQQLLDEYLKKYNKLSIADQKAYSSSYTNAYYNFACTYSLLGNKTEAISNLEKSIKAGYYNYSHILEDSDLDNIRNEEKFKSLIAPLREIGDYLYILKKACDYNTNDNREFPAFTYQQADNPNLQTLRKYFNLDSIAGNGNEISKIINLMHWIHNLIPHDGNHGNPTIKNAMHMIAVCKKENRGLNCRGLATVLNECYLALGFKSRFVTCLPKDSLKVDPDCHVINAVYANSLKKWVWIDPTNDAYVMNEAGELLSIQEVRERIISNRPLIVNPDANWNHRSSVEKQNYLFSYMAKNLYMLECNVNSEYDEETYGNNKTVTSITLLPLEYFNQRPDRTEFHNKDVNTTFVHYKTNNPDLFWQAP